MATTDNERKEITIDPAMFTIHNNRTKKQLPPKIKIKGLKKEKKIPDKSSTLKRNLLRMIRGHQEKRIKDSQKTPPSSTTDESPPKSDFEQSISFMSQIKKSQEQHPPPIDSLLLKRTQTLKQRPQLPTSSSYVNAMPLYSPPPPIYASNTVQQLNKPSYGCLKNGNLPTYRVWKNQTQRQHIHQKIPKSIIRTSPVQENYETQLREKIKEMSEREQHHKLKQPPTQNKMIHKKQKRILRRTFKVGKSKSYPVISVLVSNKTLRNETNLKQTELKETPISEVKQYLRKQGFIKVGTNTPNDVLREMFESASMICGELKNYSPENLLYNYFNAENKAD